MAQEDRPRPARSRRKPPPEPVALHAGPTDFSDPVLRNEMKRATVWIGLAALLALTIYLAEPLLIIFGGMVFAAMIDGGARLLGRVLKIGRMWRVTIVLLAVGAFMIWTAMFAGTQIAAQAAQLPATIEAQALKVLDWLQAHGASLNVKTTQGLIERAADSIGQVTSAVGGLIGGMTTAFGIVVLGIYFAAEPQLYQRGFAWLLPTAQRAHFEGTATQMGRTLRRLMAGRLAGMTFEGLMTWLLLWLWGVPMAALLGLLTGLLAFLPNIGAPISGALMILVGFSDSTQTGLFCIFVYLLIHTIDGNIVVPLIAKHTADLAPAVVLGMQLIMGTLFGLLGLMLADPLVAMIKVALERQSLRNEGS
ncbi:AI-2E family transporter [Novosphingobium sp.]|uniref:AI-2E family transporter n=1 Tax=Novosphingobium sp. TaxID=1874826 RepID=UPI0025E350CF|nr:AI-2E family transporter [Novosphingobium sp.]MCC6924508.1 AI-2E family transporter [Novosphingobium sp.]